MGHRRGIPADPASAPRWRYGRTRILEHLSNNELSRSHDWPHDTPECRGSVAKVVGTGTVVVTGHSLGSALATYFTDDLAERLGSRVSGCLFASPRTGDPAWTNLFVVTVKDYRLFNYILDIVTHVPTLGYATLPNATVIQPSTAQAGIRLDILCNHHVICYCAMIDYKETMAAPTTVQDASCKSCILGPSSTMPETAKALAVIINEFGVGDEKALVMLKALHTASMV